MAARNVEEAAWWAARIGLPLNRLWTIHWRRADVPDALAATGRFLKLYGDHARRHGVEPAHAWVREGGQKGEHVHILAHVPPGLNVARRQRRWLTLCRAAWRLGVLDSRPVGRTYADAWQSADSYQENLAIAVRYVLKGAAPETCERMGMGHVPGGRLIGKRCGVSQNLGSAARARIDARARLGKNSAE